MKILLVTPNPPSPQRVRPFGFARALAARGHPLTLAAPVTGRPEAADADALRRAGFPVFTAPLGIGRRLANAAWAALRGEPLQSRYAWQPALWRQLVAALAEAKAAGDPFDLAHVEHLRGSLYALALARHLPVAWDSVDCITALFAATAQHSASWRGRWVARLELGRTRRFEGRMPHRVHHTIVSSPVDAEVLAALAAEGDAWSAAVRAARDARGPIGPTGSVDQRRLAAISVIPNGVDLVYFAAPPVPRDPATVVFTGRLSYHANTTAACFLAREVMPLVWRARPACRLVLAGADPPAVVRRATAAATGPVEVTGTVDDLRPYLARATVAAAPVVYGAGVQNKVLEAMAMATPVVTSPLALRGLAAAAGRDCLVAGDAEGMASALLAVLGDEGLAARLGAAGRAYVEQHHTWDAAARGLEDVYAEIISAAPRST